MTDWKTSIDRAAEICGGQNALARRLGITSGNLSATKTGVRPLAKEHIQELARILGVDPAELWLLGQDARNPFRHAIAACIAGLIFGILSFVHIDARAHAYGHNSNSQQSADIYIVDI